MYNEYKSGGELQNKVVGTISCLIYFKSNDQKKFVVYFSGEVNNKIGKGYKNDVFNVTIKGRYLCILKRHKFYKYWLSYC